MKLLTHTIDLIKYNNYYHAYSSVIIRFALMTCRKKELERLDEEEKKKRRKQEEMEQEKQRRLDEVERLRQERKRRQEEEAEKKVRSHTITIA